MVILCSAVKFPAPKVAEALQHASALEEARFSRVRFSGFDMSKRCSRGSTSPTKLRVLEMDRIGPEAQALLLDTLPAPSTRLLIVVDPGLSAGYPTWSTILHPAVAARLDGITFTSMLYDLDSVELQQDGSTPLGRGSFTLSIAVNERMPIFLTQETEIPVFDLSHIQTLHVSRDAFGFSIYRWLPPHCLESVTRVVLRGFWYEGTLFAALPALREIYLKQPQALCSPAEPQMLVHWLRTRANAKASGGATRVDRVVVVMNRWHERLHPALIEDLERIPGMEFMDVDA